MNEHDAREGARTQRPRYMGRDRLVLVAVDRNRLRNHAFVSHCRHPSLMRKNDNRRRSIIKRRGTLLECRAYASAAGDASPSGGQIAMPSASGMRRLRNNSENIIQLPIAMTNSTCCPGSATCSATSAQVASEIDFPARHSSVAARIALSAGANRAE